MEDAEILHETTLNPAWLNWMGQLMVIRIDSRQYLVLTAIW